MGDDRHPPLERMWDIASTIRIVRLRRPPLFAVATDDSHDYHGPDGATPGRGWIMVRARGLEAGWLIDAMERGDFYASSGVVLEDVHYAPRARELTVTVDPQEGAEYTVTFIGTREGYDDTSEAILDDSGNELSVITRRYSADVGQVLEVVRGTEATYRLAGNELYVRARVDSTQPPENPGYPDQVQQAWTQPVGWRRHLGD